MGQAVNHAPLKCKHLCIHLLLKRPAAPMIGSHALLQLAITNLQAADLHQSAKQTTTVGI